MQPIFNLLSGELAALDTAIASGAPDTDAAPSVFADELGLRTPALAGPPPPGGNLLPQFGNDLPTGQPLATSHSDVQSDVQVDLAPDVQGGMPGDLSADPEDIIASLHQQLRQLQDSSAAESASGSGPLLPEPELPENIDAAAVEPSVAGPPAAASEDVEIAAAALAAKSTGDPITTPAIAQPHAARAVANTLAPVLRRPVPNTELLTEPVLANPDNLTRDLRPDRTSPEAVRSIVNTADSTQKPLVPPVQLLPVEPPVAGGNSEDPVIKPQFTLPMGAPPVSPDIALTPQPSVRASAEAPPVAPLPTTTLHAAVQEPGWRDAFAEKITLMANSKLQAAEIRLTPSDLGPLKVRLTIEEGVASVSFSAQHAVTREAIEQALPRLREMLAESGLSLERASVGEDGVAQGHRDDKRPARNGTDAHLSDEPEPEFSPDGADHDDRLRSRDGLVDTFV